MKKEHRSPWFWVPSIYYAEGIPYIVVMTVSVIMYKRMGVSNTDIALYTSWLYLPWVIKPLWSPIVDILRTKRFWIVTMQLIIGVGLGGVALTIPLPGFFKYTLLFFWLLAFSSATHDIAADGFYMLGLTQHEQAWYVGVRSTFYRFAMITGQGLLIILAGFIESQSGMEELELQVVANPAQSIEHVIDPDSINIEPEEGELRIRSYPEKLEISTNNIDIEKADSLIAAIKQHNINNGHTLPETADQQSDSYDPSLWARYFADPLEKYLKDVFGEKAVDIQDTGNIGIVYFHLTKKPEQDETIVVNFSRESGDKSIGLIEGGRLEFDESNWNKPAVALIQLDPKLEAVTKATFSAQSGNIKLAWSVTFIILASMFFIFFIYHRFILPYPDSDRPAITDKAKGFLKEFFDTFILFFKKERIGIALSFLLLFRLAEAQLVKLASPFLLDTQEMGGLALTTGEVGFVYGTVGLLFLTFGGLLGGFLAAKKGLKYWLWPMAIAINLPDAVYIYLAYALPDNFLIINACVAIEQFGYGFGFTAYMLYMIYISEGKHKTAHFAITTAFMALGMMIPGMISGWLQEIIGYQNFFIWVLIATIPGFIILFFLPVDPEFGKKKDS